MIALIKSNVYFSAPYLHLTALKLTKNDHYKNKTLENKCNINDIGFKAVILNL